MKTILVTGAGAGLGAATATRAAKLGYRVGVLDLDGDKARAVAGDLPSAVALQADVTSEASVGAALAAFGAVPDVLVNNAGIVRFGTLLDQGIETFRKVLDVNLMGTVVPSLLVGRRMVERGSGVIISTTSINALTPGPNTGAYPPSKAAVGRFTELAALEWGPAGVRVNCVAPGFIDAGMSAPIYANPGVRALRGGAVPLRRLGTAEDVAAAILFLASDEASYINGHELVVDGGVVHSLLSQLPREPGAKR
ncbi:MAG: SDR family oxidoreductase [Alphaproteobacteria bacterium]|nr:SDR family oxidoreductase [Alphaproteobacteria bacterium]